jgi:tRNA(Arg) A34 adenosine deaminase TadA
MADDDVVDVAFMRAALLLGSAALESREVPVGCLLVSRGRVLARAHNATNATYDATRHAEMVALDAVVSLVRGGGGATELPAGAPTETLLARVRALLSAATLFVTVEPCIMCAAALRRAGVGRVVYGCGNEKFGGAGTVLDVLGAAEAGADESAAVPRVTAGVCRDEAVALLKRFYARANPAAPVPRTRPAAAGDGAAAATVAAADAAAIDDAVSTAEALAVKSSSSRGRVPAPPPGELPEN